MHYWKQVHLRHAQSLTPSPESLDTIWLSVGQLPETLYRYDFDGPITHGHAQRKNGQRALANHPVPPRLPGVLPDA